MIGLNEVHCQVKQTFREFAQARIAPGARERDQSGEFAYELISELANIGVFGMPFAEELGGQGADTVSFVVALEEIARADQSAAALVANQVGLSAMPLALFGNKEQHRWLPHLFAGTSLGAFGLSEPGAGSDTGGITTTATRDGSDWVLRGGKTFITNAGTDRTDFVIIAARTDSPASGSTGMFLVETGLPGFHVGPPLKKIGWRSSDTREIFLDECRVPAAAVLGDPERGVPQFLSALDFGRIQIATLGVGLTQAALDTATEHAAQRTAFGRRIGEFQGIGFKLADIEVDAHAARLLTVNAAAARDAGEPFGHQAAIAKLFASEAAMRASHQCVQIHGGSGFMDDSTAARLFRDAKILEIGEGTSEIQRMVISRHLLANAGA